METLVLPDYDHSLLSITTSILKHYGIDYGYKGVNQLDKRLKNNPKNVIYILVDALGAEILKKHPKKASFLLKQQKDTLTTVFPSTTTSATTTALTGLPPIQTSWIGWQQFLKEEERHVVFFRNIDYYHEDHQFEYNVADRYVAKTKIYDLIADKNDDVSVHEIFPKFRQEDHDSIQKQVETALKMIEDDQKHFIYMYWDQVDSLLHDHGTTSKEVADEVGRVNDAIKYLFDQIDDDTVVVLTADHGQIDIKPVSIMTYDDVVDMLAQKPAIEARATAFYVKPEHYDDFPDVFNKHFRHKFALYKSEELLDMQLFGQGKQHPKFREFLGDYFSIAIDQYAFNLLDKPAHKATHAGLTKDEMMIPLIMNDKK